MILETITSNSGIAICVTICFTIFMWEYIQLDVNTRVKPSYVLNLMARNAYQGFEFCGRMMARISSFLTWIELRKIRKTIENIIMPIWKLLTSFTGFLQGYLYQAINYYGEPSAIIVGSALLIIGLVLSGVAAMKYYGFDDIPRMFVKRYENPDSSSSYPIISAILFLALLQAVLLQSNVMEIFSVPYSYTDIIVLALMVIFLICSFFVIIYIYVITVKFNEQLDPTIIPAPNTDVHSIVHNTDVPTIPVDTNVERRSSARQRSASYGRWNIPE
jgi:hypothetical protein